MKAPTGRIFVSKAIREEEDAGWRRYKARKQAEKAEKQAAVLERKAKAASEAEAEVALLVARTNASVLVQQHRLYRQRRSDQPCLISLVLNRSLDRKGTRCVPSRLYWPRDEYDSLWEFGMNVRSVWGQHLGCVVDRSDDP